MVCKLKHRNSIVEGSRQKKAAIMVARKQERREGPEREIHPSRSPPVTTSSDHVPPPDITLS